MNAVRTLILGASGQLGVDVMHALPAADVVGVDLPEVDVADAASVTSCISRHSPRVVINCAAWTNVEEAEDRVDDTFRINALGALHVAKAAAASGARLIYISTDYVFGDEPGRLLPYAESDRPAPLNVYGASKLAGEHLTLAYCPRSLVIRTASLYGHAGARGKGGNFVETMLRLAASGKPIRVVADQRMTPTSTRALAAAINQVLSHAVTGILHLTSRDDCSWFEFAAAIFEHENLRVELTPIRAAEYPTKARRSSFSALASERREVLGLGPAPSWREMLAEYLELRAARGSTAEQGLSRWGRKR